MPDTVKLACIQIDSGTDIKKNIDNCAALIRESAGKGAEFISTPENTDFIRTRYPDMAQTAMGYDDHVGIREFGDLASELGITLHIGSLTIKNKDDTLSNRSFIFGPDGDIIAEYNKIHMFDVTLANGESYRESKAFRPGEEAVIADTKFGKVGLTICYDLRFPYLYRSLAHKGAKVIMVPAAFTVPTGKAHWEALLRARAIENTCYIVASAQTGSHDGEKDTYGHSLVISPWGEVLADGGTGVGIVQATLDFKRLEEIRSSIPSLTHDREYS